MKYDPLTGFLQRTARPLGFHPIKYRGQTMTPQRVIAELLNPTQPPKFYLQADESCALAGMMMRHTDGILTRPIPFRPGIGLLTLDANGMPYRPQPDHFALQAWRDRDVCTKTGRIEFIRHQNTTQIKLRHPTADGTTTLTVLYRAQLVAAAALHLHPLTPVMAWYKHDPEIFGYGFDNVFTPTASGFVQYDRYAPPVAAHETAHPYTGTSNRRPRYVVHLED